MQNRDIIIPEHIPMLIHVLDCLLDFGGYSHVIMKKSISLRVIKDAQRWKASLISNFWTQYLSSCLSARLLKSNYRCSDCFCRSFLERFNIMLQYKMFMFRNLCTVKPRVSLWYISENTSTILCWCRIALVISIRNRSLHLGLI
jgi:hypothetical protein